MAAAPSFAEQQLAKYGWRKGSGLGKDGGGITRAITVSRRADNRGIGSDSNQWNSNWWDNLYNKATGNVGAATSNDASEKSADGKDEEASYQAKMAAAATERDTLSEYQGMFVRSAVDTPTSQSGTSTPAPSEGTSRGSGTPVDRTKLVREGNVHFGTTMTDAELFAACEGRTARKGARAEQTGKLARVSGGGMPRPEVVARIEAALSGRLPELASTDKPKRNRSKDEGAKDCKDKLKTSKLDKVQKSREKKEKRKDKGKDKKRRKKDAKDD